MVKENFNSQFNKKRKMVLLLKRTAAAKKRKYSSVFDYKYIYKNKIP